MRLIHIALFLLVLGAAAVAAGEDTDLTTRFEATAGEETPRYDETVDYCRRVAAASPMLHYTTFGTSPQGRPLPLLIADRRGNFTAAEVRATGNAVLLVEACIHAGECCGKDAGLMLLRDLALRGEHGGVPENVTVLFIPIFNVDGHERFTPFGRANQNGPREMGWRVTAQNLNLNRDFLKADQPEMRDWLRLWCEWLPEFFVDIHSTDGADYQYPATYSLETHGNMDAGVTAWTRDRYEAELVAAMAADGMPIQRYCIFRKRHDPRSGLRSWAASPRLSQGYSALHNRPGLLIEAHMLKPYPVRVETVYAMLAHTLEILETDAARLCELTRGADERIATPAFRAEPFPLDFEATEDSVMIDFLGVEYETVPSEISGGDWVRYHPDRPATFHIPHFDRQRPSVTATLPEAYLVPPQWTEVIERLEAHGVETRRLAEAATVEVRSWRFSDPQWSARPYEGRQTVRFEQEELHEQRRLPAGTVIVDMNQRAAGVAAHILEPRAPDSYVYWGFFAPIFSRVEYIESYAAEELARKMLAEEPGLADELEVAKAADPELAGDPWAIRYWFYKRSPWYDQRHLVYPVGMLDSRETVEGLPD